jgi:Zn-dependent protease
MARAFTIGRLCGIRVDVHASWFIVFAFVTLTIAKTAPLSALGGVRSYAIAALAAAALFASVVVHELAHALVARRFGVRTQAIALFLFGGVATLECEPPTPLADALVALAGPAMSAALALAAFGALRAADALVPAAAFGTVAAILAYLTVVNGVLAAFNLLPAYPMDGGRVLRALIWKLRGDRDGATASASLTGMVFAAMFIFAGIVAVAATRTWQLSWYVVLAAFVFRQCWVQYRALRTLRAVPARLPLVSGGAIEAA